MGTISRTRSCVKDRSASMNFTAKGSKQICIPLSRQKHNQIWHDAGAVRSLLDKQINEFPEIFPSAINQGYQLSGRLPESKKMPGIRLRQLRLKSGVYSLRPSFVMSYMSGDVEVLENGLFLLSVNTPTWIVSHVCGYNDMFWHRHLERLGRNHLVGTTVPIAKHLPVHLVADEHHCDWMGEKGYVAFTAGGGCILRVSLSASADEIHLTEAYGVFATETNLIYLLCFSRTYLDIVWLHLLA